MRAKVFGTILAALVAAVVTTIAHSALAATDKVALIIGNAAYQHTPALRNTIADAEAVGETFERLGFAVTYARDQSFGDLRNSLSDFRREAARAKVAVVFYAGHGIEVERQNYLIPVDAKLKSDGDVEFESISLDLVLRAISGASRFRMVILDACRDNPFLNTMSRQVTSRSIGRGLARVEPVGETLVAFAAKEGTTADDGDGEHSPFTRALLTELEEPGLEVGLLFRKVRDSVIAATGGVQEPFVYGSLSSRAFYFNEPTAQPGEGSGAVSQSGGGVDQSAVETAFWKAVETSGRKDGFERYLERYPDGVFAEAARVWLKTFEPDAGPDKSRIASVDQTARPGEDRPAADTALGAEPPILECDKLAADPRDTSRVALGVTYEEMVAEKAIPACREAHREYPRSARISYQLARSLNADAKYDEARGIFEEIAGQGYSAAMDQFGVMLALGKGGDKDYPRAMQLFQEAAAQGNGDAVFHIGLLHHNGLGVPRNFNKAVEFYERAIAEYEHPSAMSNLGTLYARGLGVKKDLRRSVELYQSAADLGHALALNNLGNIYRDGAGVPRDYGKALSMLTQGAEKGATDAMYGLAGLYHQGQGTGRDMRKSAEWMLKAIKGGSDLAANEMTTNARAWSPEFRRELQVLMRDAGAYAGAIDGEFGAGTQRAIETLSDGKEQG
jgi:tetratricopeptide (TPR) repeat protein